MESSQTSQSEVSSEGGNLNNVPQLNLSQFVKDQFAKKISQQSEIGEKKLRIFTVAQTLKDPSILAYIKPDYGSLGDFIGDINLSKDLLNQKKRKNEIAEEQQEEKRLRQKLKDKNQRQLHQIYLNDTIPTGQRRTAGKIMIQNIFRDAFGISLQSFEAQNSQNQHILAPVINLDRIDEIFKKEGDKSIYSNQSLKKTQKITYGFIDNLRYSDKSLQAKFWSTDRRLDTIQKYKQKYDELKKIKQVKVEKRFSVQQSAEESSRKDHKKSHRASQIIDIDQRFIRIQNSNLDGEKALALMKQNDIQDVKGIALNKVRVSNQVLFFILDLCMEFCSYLQKLTLSNISIENPQSFAEKIKELLRRSSLKYLTLQYLDLGTKQFCILCLGIAQNNTLQDLTLDHNYIDQHCYKSLEMVCRHCPRLKKISMKYNHLSTYMLGRQIKEKVVF